MAVASVSQLGSIFGKTTENIKRDVRYSEDYLLGCGYCRETLLQASIRYFIFASTPAFPPLPI
jgi:hypothetical protein